MKIICSYCRKDMGEKEPLEDTDPTHSICDECYAYYIDQIRGMSCSDYLDRYDVPILIVDRQGRVAASNRRAQEALGRSEREMTGLLGGEVMECEFARLPGGCGGTEHCLACSIRKTVEETFNTGESVLRKKTYLNRSDRRYELVISTCRVNGFVRIIVEEMN